MGVISTFGLPLMHSSPIDETREQCHAIRPDGRLH